MKREFKSHKLQKNTKCRITGRIVGGQWCRKECSYFNGVEIGLGIGVVDCKASNGKSVTSKRCISEVPIDNNWCIEECIRSNEFGVNCQTNSASIGGAYQKAESVDTDQVKEMDVPPEPLMALTKLLEIQTARINAKIQAELDYRIADASINEDFEAAVNLAVAYYDIVHPRN